MVQQKIQVFESTENIKESLISHFNRAFFFHEEIKNDFELHTLHDSLRNKDEILKQGTDQNTIFHKAIYSTFDDPDYFSSDFWKSYKKLCINIVQILKDETDFRGEWSIQRFPTIRFQFPNNVSVFEFHRDSNYSHPLGEINCFYALNQCLNTSALQVEKNLGFEDYEPLNLKSGEYAILNTSIFKHGDLINLTGKTRVSMDFRFIPNKHLKDVKSSLSKGISFSSDSYFITESAMRDLS
tara:strand:- start:1259 stop:1978 length:720 start_codon:yes stop_codon:yes gene_type:complete